MSKFPGLIECATEFNKQHVFSAYSRRREETGMVGVSLNQIRDHLIQNNPSLKAHGISISTVTCLMEPPRPGIVSARRYKGLIKACVPGKQNSYREDHPD